MATSAGVPGGLRRRTALTGALVIAGVAGCTDGDPAPPPPTTGPSTSPDVVPVTKYLTLKVPDGARPMAVAQTKDGVKAFYPNEDGTFTPAGREVHFTVNHNGKPDGVEKGKMPEAGSSWVSVSVGPPELNSDGSFAGNTPFVAWGRGDNDEVVLESFTHGENGKENLLSVPQGELFQVSKFHSSPADNFGN